MPRHLAEVSQNLALLPDKYSPLASPHSGPQLFPSMVRVCRLASASCGWTDEVAEMCATELAALPLATRPLLPFPSSGEQVHHHRSVAMTRQDILRICVAVEANLEQRLGGFWSQWTISRCALRVRRWQQRHQCVHRGSSIREIQQLRRLTLSSSSDLALTKANSLGWPRLDRSLAP